MNLEEAEAFALDKLNNNLPVDLSYHSKAHVLDVLQAAMMYAEAEELNDHEKKLLQTAVLFHDIGFVIQSADHERIGCQMATETLPRYGYSETDIQQICGMIMATKIPQSPRNKLEEIIADADLDYLGRDDFWKISSLLFQELKAYNVLSDPHEWNKIQLDFLGKHHYFTSTANRLRGEKKREHTEQVKRLVDAGK